MEGGLPILGKNNRILKSHIYYGGFFFDCNLTLVQYNTSYKHSVIQAIVVRSS